MAAANAEKTSAQQEAHDLQLKMRELKARRLSPREARGPENASVLNKIMSMEDKSQGQGKQHEELLSHTFSWGSLSKVHFLLAAIFLRMNVFQIMFHQICVLYELARPKCLGKSAIY